MSKESNRKDKERTIAQLREVADWLEARDLGDAYPYVGNCLIMCETPEAFGHVVALQGQGKKNDYGNNLWFESKLPSGAVVHSCIGKELTCQKIKTGTRTVTKPILTQTGTEEVTEDVYEFCCPDSFLALGKAA